MFCEEASVDLYWVLGSLQVLGLLTAWMARVSEGSRWQSLFQHVFLGGLILMGGASVVSLDLGSGCWLTCGTTLSLMVLMATCDFRRCQRATAW